MVFLGSWGDLQIWLIEWLTRCTREGMKGGVGEVEGGRYGLGGGRVSGGGGGGWKKGGNEKGGGAGA